LCLLSPGFPFILRKWTRPPPPPADLLRSPRPPR
jgi:hypothetical protein